MVILYGPHGYWPHWLPGVTAFVFYFITTFFIVRGMKNKQSGKISSYDTVESMPRKQV
jgi:hypothetical protein